MKRLFIHNIFFRIFAPIVIGVMVYLLILLINNKVADVEKLFNDREVYIMIILSYASLESMRLVLIGQNRFILKESDQIGKRLLIQFILTGLVCILVVVVCISLYFKYLIGFSIGHSELNLFISIYLVVSLLYNLLFFSQYYLHTENKLQMDQEKKMQENLESDFVSFRNQINPDLLYESLENLILTLHHNVELAEEQIDYLAAIYRYNLVNRNKELITLQEELYTAEQLLKLLNMRHHQNLHLQSELGSLDGMMVISGSLLITIDTIVRNTLISSQSPLVMRLYREDENYLVMQHALNDRLLIHAESQQTFKKLQHAYTFFSDDPFVQVKAGRENFIKFPLIMVASETLTP